MKSWIRIPNGSTDWRRVVLHKLGGCVARLLLFGSVFLIHPGERCAYETGWPPAPSADVPSEVTPHPVADAPSAPTTFRSNSEVTYEPRRGRASHFRRAAYRVPEETAQCEFRQTTCWQPHADRLVATMATGQLVTLLESMCVREIRRYLDPDAEVVVGHSIQLRHSPSIPRGALLRIKGWVHSIGDRDVTFFVHAQDDLEQICEGTIRLVVVRRGEIARRIDRKSEAIARRELFLTA